MMKFNYDLAMLIFWFLYGLTRLICKEKISKVNYGCVWVLLVMYLLFDYAETLG